MDTTRDLSRIVDLGEPLSEVLSQIDTVSIPENDKVGFAFRRSNVTRALSLYLDHQLSADHLEGWANVIEALPTLRFPDGDERLLQQMIFKLANPNITKREITPEYARELLSLLA